MFLKFLVGDEVFFFFFFVLNMNYNINCAFCNL